MSSRNQYQFFFCWLKPIQHLFEDIRFKPPLSLVSVILKTIKYFTESCSKVYRLSVLISAVLLAFSITGCKKNKSGINCGCAPDSYQSLSDSDGTLFFMNNQYQQAWFIVVDFPNNAKWLCKICNIDKGKNLINNISISDTISVKISGQLKNFCPDESVGIISGIAVPYHIIIDSLKEN
jgi:hypothetical protein